MRNTRSFLSFQPLFPQPYPICDLLCRKHVRHLRILTARSKPDARSQLRGVGIAAASLMLASTINLLWMWGIVGWGDERRCWVFRDVSGDDSAGSMAKSSFHNIQISKPLCFFFFLERDEVCSSVRRPLHSSTAHLHPIALSGTS